jgi:hypothetical protein
MPDKMEETEQTVTEVTRRGIADALIIEAVAWYGDLNEVDFLSRLYDQVFQASTGWVFDCWR